MRHLNRDRPIPDDRAATHDGGRPSASPRRSSNVKGEMGCRPAAAGFVASIAASVVVSPLAWTPAAARADESRADESRDDESRDGFYLSSADGANRVRIGLNLVYRFEPRIRNGSWQDRDAIYVARPYLRGNIFRSWIRFLNEFELAQNPPYLLYSYLEVSPRRYLRFKIGQQDSPISRHENFGVMRVLFADTDLVAGYFWPGRDKGVTVFGALGAERVDYYVGVYGGSPLRQFTTIAGNYVVAGRLTVNPMGNPMANPMEKTGDAEFAYALAGEQLPLRVSFTLQGYYGKIQSASENFDSNTFQFQATPTGLTERRGAGGVDLLLQSGRVVAFVEGYAGRTDPSGGAEYTSIGAWGQVGFLLVPRFLDAAVRLGWVDPSLDLDEDRFLSAEAQVAWYLHAPALILRLRYGIGDQQSPGDTALGAVVLPAAIGRTQVITLQVNLAL
jgi:hypothetical protein